MGALMSTLWAMWFGNKEYKIVMVSVVPARMTRLVSHAGLVTPTEQLRGDAAHSTTMLGTMGLRLLAPGDSNSSV